MKKLILTLLIVCLLISTTACTQPEITEDEEDIDLDIDDDIESLEDLEEELDLEDPIKDGDLDL